MASSDDDDDNDDDVGSSAMALRRNSVAAPPVKMARVVYQQPRLNAFLPSAVHEANELEREREQSRLATGDVTRCAICWEQQEHDDAFGDVAERSRASALAQSSARMRSIIFAFERRLRGRAHDDIIFEVCMRVEIFCTSHQHIRVFCGGGATPPGHARVTTSIRRANAA